MKLVFFILIIFVLVIYGFNMTNDISILINPQEYDKLDDDEFDYYKNIIENELNVSYTNDILHRIKLTIIVLGHWQYAFDGYTDLSNVNSDNGYLIFLNIAYNKNKNIKDLISTLNHELFHVMDHTKNNILLSCDSYFDIEWSNLSKYYPKTIVSYSSTNNDEDKATIYELIMNPYFHNKFIPFDKDIIMKAHLIQKRLFKFDTHFQFLMFKKYNECLNMFSDLITIFNNINKDIHYDNCNNLYLISSNFSKI
jgi:hypothetical protein